MTPPSRFLTLCVYALFIICPLLFFTDLTRNPYYTQIALLNIITCICWLIWIAEAWKTGEWIWVRSPLDGVLWALLGICAVSWGVSYWQHPNLRTPIYSEGSRGFIFMIVNVYLVYAMAVRYLDRERMRHILWATYAVTFVASVYGIAQYYGMEWIWPHSLNPYGSRPVSTFGNPNFLSSYLVVVIPVMIADYVFKITRIARVPLFVVIISSVGALIATLTRSSWAGAVAAVIVGASVSAVTSDVWHKVRVPAVILGVALIGLMAAWPKSSSAAYSETVLGRLKEVEQIKTGTYGAVTQRLLIWTSAWEMVQDHPILGKGWGTFELFFPFYQGSLLDKKEFINYRTHANNSHDEILEQWSQIGTVGLGIVVLLWLVFIRTVLSISRRLPLPWKALEGGFLGGAIGMLVDNLLNVSVHFAVPAFIFWWWVGSAMVLDPAATEIKRFSLQPVWRRLALVAAAITLVCFSARSAMLWAEEVYFFHGFKLSKGGADLPLAKMYLEKAYAYHNLDVNNVYELANVDARMGLKPESMKMYQRALDANAGYDEIYFNRATMAMQMGLYDEAIWNYRMALSINPLSHEAYNALESIYVKDIPKYGDAAVVLYHRALEIFPGDKDLWNNLGYLEVQRQHWPEAVQAYQKALEIDPHFDVARHNLELIIHKGNASTGSAPKR